MGKRGPAPMPTQLKVLHGEKRAERLNRAAPKPKGNKPIMPPGMTPEAQKVWRRQTRAMDGLGILTAVDADALRCYCEAVDRMTVASDLFALSSPLIAGRDGNLVRNPLHQIVRDNAMLIRLFARDLGFLPSAREGLHVNSDKDMDPLEDWMKR